MVLSLICKRDSLVQRSLNNLALYSRSVCPEGFKSLWNYLFILCSRLSYLCATSKIMTAISHNWMIYSLANLI